MHACCRDQVSGGPLELLPCVKSGGQSHRVRCTDFVRDDSSCPAGSYLIWQVSNICHSCITTLYNTYNTPGVVAREQVSDSEQCITRKLGG